MEGGGGGYFISQISALMESRSDLDAFKSQVTLFTLSQVRWIDKKSLNLKVLPHLQKDCIVWVSK